MRGKPVRRGDIFKIVGLAAFVGIVSLVSWLVWPYIHMMFEPGGIDQVIDSVRNAGPMGFLILFALQFLQIVVAFIPGEATPDGRRHALRSLDRRLSHLVGQHLVERVCVHGGASPGRAVREGYGVREVDG